MATALQILAFVHNCGKLKRIKRSGWLRYDIPEVESVADHSYRLAVLCMLVSRNIGVSDRLDAIKMLKMALLHDLAEILTGDITPKDGISREAKSRLEAGAMKQILNDVDDDGELFGLWEEYNTGKTEEAKIVNALDKLEMAFQAKEYEADCGDSLEEFYTFEPDEFTPELVDDLYKLLKKG
ncbi:MAG: HD domain-containing protein [Thermoplasmata archaeon]|nr:MAG: HD domain-containing protein [Thermoplasmata archaeon]